jgi:hypothetical protein
MRLLATCVVAGLVAACGRMSDAPADAPDAAPVEAAATTASDTAHTAAEHSAAPPAPALREITIPAGTTLRLELKSAIASDSSRVEDQVRAALRQPIVIDGRTVVPAGAAVVGTVTSVERSGRVRGLAHIAYRFDSLDVEGERHAIRTAPLSHQAEATKGEDATKVAVGAGAGAAIGALLGGGDGAAKGAAIGGAAGTGAVLATRGREVRLDPGAEVTTQLTAPLTVRVRM